MTTTRSDPVDAVVHDLEPAVALTVRRFLGAVAAGRGGELSSLYADGASADCTVPNWRFAVRGAMDIGRQYARWYADPAVFAEIEVRSTTTGVVLRFLITWEEHGVPHAAHHCHVLDLGPGGILRDAAFCGGRWSAALLAQMEEAARGR